MNKSTYLQIAAVVAAAAIVAILVIHSKNNDEPMPLVQEDNAVVIADQNPGEDAEAVVVSYAKLANPGYVVVTSKDPVTNQSYVVGTSELLPAGEHFNVKVKRSSPRRHKSKQPEPVTAQLVADDGDGVYESEDAVVVTDGEEVVAEAVVSESTEETGELTPEEVAAELEEGDYTVNDDADVLQDEPAEDVSESGDADEAQPGQPDAPSASSEDEAQAEAE